MKTFSPEIQEKIIRMQTAEITEYHIYLRLARIVKGRNNREVLHEIAQDELKHYDFWKKYSGEEIEPRWLWVRIYTLMSKLFGLTFSVKLMERGEGEAQVEYEKLIKRIPEVKEVLEDEGKHEQQLIGLLDEAGLKYMGSVVLGISDALVELTGALAGLTFALQNVHLVGITGLITGLAASLSMAASEYLSTTEEDNDQDPLRASVYTGIAYVSAVLLLIFPYFIFDRIYAALGMTLFNAIIIILVFTFYSSVAKGTSFKKRFFKMTGISLGVAAISFGIGYLVRTFLGVDV